MGEQPESLTPVWLAIKGNCPGTEEVQTELRGLVDLVDGATAPEGAFELQAARTRNTVRIRLHRPGSGRPLTRRIRSRDCVSVARAISLIVERHFHELSLPVGTRQQKAPEEEVHEVAVVEPEPEPEPTPVPPEPEPPPPPPWRLLFSLGAGGRLDLDPAEMLGTLQLGLGFVSPDGPVLRLELAANTADRMASKSEQLEVQAGRAEFELGWNLLSGPHVLAPHVGVGARVVSVTATSLPDTPDTLRAALVLSAGFLSAFQLVGPLYGLAQITGSLTPLTDRYVVEPIGEVGRLSRFEVALILGLGIAADL